MRFTIVITDRNFYDDLLKEFKKDRIIVLDDDKELKSLLGNNKEASLDNIDNLLKLRLIQKYKNLIFIDTKLVKPLEGLRNEILYLKKVKAKLFLQNVKRLNNCNIFYSKKCPSIIEEMLYIFDNSKDFEFLKKSFLFKKDICNYEFEHISWDF